MCHLNDYFSEEERRDGAPQPPQDGTDVEQPQQPVEPPVSAWDEPQAPTEPVSAWDEPQASTEPQQPVEPPVSAWDEPQQSKPVEEPRYYAPQPQPQPMFGGSSYPPQPPQHFYAPPQPYGYAMPQPEPPKKKRKVLRRLIAALVVIAILGSAAGVFAILYDVESNDRGGFTVVRDDRFGRGDESLPSGDFSIYASPSPMPDSGVSAEPAGDSGPELIIADSPVTEVDYGDVGRALTKQEIAAKCTEWTVGVVATSYVQSYYYGYGGAATSTGTGIIMSEDGYIITNHHVVEGATDLSIVMMDGSEHTATLIGSDARSDLAVLKIEASGLPAAEFGDSDALLVGDPVVAIGNPLGLELMGTVTDGIVSAINRDVAVEERTMTLIQTNAAINSGNSGGPLINQYGQVVGINNMKMQNYATTVEGLGFAIPTNTAKVIIDELIDKGYVSGYPAIGIRYDNVNQSMSQYYSIPVGVLVRYIYPDSNAYQAGLQVNDVIVSAQGETVTEGSELMAIMDRHSAGDEFTIEVYHYDSRQYETITFNLNDENDLVDGTIIGQ